MMKNNTMKLSLFLNGTNYFTYFNQDMRIGCSISKHEDSLVCSSVTVGPCKAVGSHTAGQDMSRFDYISLNEVHYCQYVCGY